MAVSPILLNSLPFDATKSHILQFTYSGSQVFGHRIVIKNNATLEEVYNSNKILGMALQATVPANTLINGNTYSFQISVFDYEGKESPLSNIVVLKCFATPTFHFANITDKMIIKNSYIDAELQYHCDDTSEVLNQYNILLYGIDKTTVIYDSGNKYMNSGLITRISGLTDDTTYYIRATGATLNGMELDTGFLQIMCDYIKPDLFLAFRADNIPEEGSVRLSVNYVLVEGKSSPEELVYIDDDKVSLVNGEKVWFDSGYTAKNFTCDIIAENIVDYSTIISFNMKTAQAYVKWYKGTFEGHETESYYAELVAYQYVGDDKLNYIQISNLIDPPTDGEQVHFWIRHVDGAFDIKIAKLNKEESAQTVEDGDVA